MGWSLWHCSRREVASEQCQKLYSDHKEKENEMSSLHSYCQASADSTSMHVIVKRSSVGVLEMPHVPPRRKRVLSAVARQPQILVPAARCLVRRAVSGDLARTGDGVR